MVACGQMQRLEGQAGLRKGYNFSSIRIDNCQALAAVALRALNAVKARIYGRPGGLGKPQQSARLPLEARCRR